MKIPEIGNRLSVVKSDGRTVRLSAQTETETGSAYTVFKIRLTNNTSAKLEVSRVRLWSWDSGQRTLSVYKQGFYMPGDPAGFYRLRAGEPMPFAGWRKPAQVKDTEFWSHSVTGVKLPGNRSLLAGFTAARRFESYFVFRPRKGLFRLEAWCELEDRELAPGDALDLEPLMLSTGRDFTLCLDRYTQAAAETNGALTDSATVTGWIDWQYYREEKTENDILENASVLARLRKQGYPLDYVIIDGGWCDGASEWLRPCRKFPGGMAALSRKIRRKGLKFGLWFAPYITNIETDVARKHPEWMVIDKATGRPLKLGYSNVGPCTVLDFTVAGARAWLRRVVRKMVRDWKIGYLKLDGPNPGHYRGGRFHDPSQTISEQIRTSLEVIREECGPDVLVEGEGIYLPSLGLVDIQRTQQDNFPFWYYPHNGQPRMKVNMFTDLMSAFTHNTFWKNHRENIILRDSPSPFHALKFVNADLKDPILPDNELKLQVTGCALAGGALLLSDRMVDLVRNPDRVELISRFLPPWEAAARPLDTFSDPAPAFYYLPVLRTFEDWFVLGVFNWHDEYRDFKVPLKFADAGESWCAFEFWREEFLGIFEGSLPIRDVAPHACRLIALRRKTAVPQLLGTNMHLYQGAVELDDFRYAKNRMHIKVGHFRQKESRLFLRRPRGWRLGKIETNAADYLLDDRQKELVILSFNGRPGRKTRFDIAWKRS